VLALFYVNVAACGASLTSCDDCRERAVQGRVRDLRRRQVERGKPWCRIFTVVCCAVVKDSIVLYTTTLMVLKLTSKLRCSS
jgi:hypothetical protein